MSNTRKSFNPECNRRGFTLIETMVVIIIIGLLSTMIVVGSSSARARARDTRRVNDLAQVRNALETYKLSAGRYPISGPTDGAFWYSSCDTENYLGATCREDWVPGLSNIIQLPKDPINTCPLGGDCYIYLYGSDGLKYKLMAWQMESGMGQNLAKNDHGATPQAGKDYCTGSRFDETLKKFYNDCTYISGAAPGSCERNGNSGGGLNYEIYSTGGRCL